MVERDVVLGKVGSIQRCLKRIRDVTQLKPESLQDIDVQDVFVLNLQRAVQGAIDLASHVVASEGLGMPQDIRETFLILHRAGIIPADLSERMRKMVGFRNIAVHEYQDLDLSLLQAILVGHLRDLEEFYTLIVERFRVV
jgi:uncharacterized protein YutE (UPF0331/DUF86 family)